MEGRGKRKGDYMRQRMRKGKRKRKDGVKREAEDKAKEK